MIIRTPANAIHPVHPDRSVPIGSSRRVTGLLVGLVGHRSVPLLSARSAWDPDTDGSRPVQPTVGLGSPHVITYFKRFAIAHRDAAALDRRVPGELGKLRRGPGGVRDALRASGSGRPRGVAPGRRGRPHPSVAVGMAGASSSQIVGAAQLGSTQMRDLTPRTERTSANRSRGRCWALCLSFDWSLAPWRLTGAFGSTHATNSADWMDWTDGTPD